MSGPVPMAPVGGDGATGSPVVRRLLRFARLARENGFHVGIDESLDALALAHAVDVLDGRQMRWALRSLFSSSAGDWKRFDELFDAFWVHRERRYEIRVSGTAPRGGGEFAGGAAPAAGSERGDAEAGRRGGASRTETLAGTDFRHLQDPAEQRAVHDLTARLAARMRWRLTRRRRVRARGPAIDLRNTIHKSLRHGGVPLHLAYRRRWPKPLKLVVLLDASGSMSLYSTFFIHFLRGVVDNFDRSEAFVFHTRLVHLSRALKERNIERAIERLTVMSAGWGGGTRIGECLRIFNANYAASVLNGRSVVVILSDGYDTGAPELLAAQLKRLRRRARRVIWLNPLLGWKDYEPVARGMAAALPHVDLFAPAHNLESLAALEPYFYKL